MTMDKKKKMQAEFIAKVRQLGFPVTEQGREQLAQRRQEPVEMINREMQLARNKKLNDGSSAEKAVIIHADSTITGVPEEYRYLKKVCGKIEEDFTIDLQMQIRQNESVFDLIYVTIKKDGSKRHFWFDITASFGKL